MNMIYEVPFKFYMNPSDVVFILLIFIYAFPVINKIKMEIYHINISNERAYEKFFEIFRRVFYIVVTSFCILGTVIQLHILCKTFGVYKRGDYEVVEGYVDNFDPAENHIPEETFEINGVKFFIPMNFYNRDTICQTA